MIATVILLYFVLTRLYEVEKEILLFPLGFVIVISLFILVGQLILTGAINLFFTLLIIFI